MKRVLLAINGDIPNKSAFQYAIGLCSRISAELNIVQFIKAKKMARCIRTTRNKVRQLGRVLEDSFAGAAFAEEGAFDAADEILNNVSNPLRELIEHNTANVSFKVAVSNGDPETDLTNYIEDHQQVVLTIFDPSKDKADPSGNYRTMIEHMKKKLCVPLVVVTA